MMYEIIYVVSGIIRLGVDQKSYIVGRDSLIFLSNFEEHSTEILSAQYERYFLLLDAVKLEQIIQDPVLVSICKVRSGRFSHVVPAPSYTAQIMEHILSEYQCGDSYSEGLAASWIKYLLVNLYRSNASYFPIANKTFRQEIYSIKQEIDQNFLFPIHIGELADKYYISSYYLSHAFKELTGYSPKHYLTLTRLSYAKIKLHDTFDSIETIGMQSGFLDANSFIRSFKDEFGITPMQYRKQRK